MKILVLGATGMLGHAMFRVLASGGGNSVFGTARLERARLLFAPDLAPRLLTGVDVSRPDSLVAAFATARPEVVVNCVGVVKQLAEAADPLQALPLNAVLPHRLAALCRATGARLVHVSTDCVFSGRAGMYTEADAPDATDLYGRSKLLGEPDQPHTVTLRTSIIGRELEGRRRGLVDWFLSQAGPVDGYRRAIFSGLPTVELATVVRDVVLPRPDLAGVYHVAAAPIAKLDLLRLIAAAYGHAAEIRPRDEPAIDRSLDAGRFRAATGYEPPAWPELVRRMHAFD